MRLALAVVGAVAEAGFVHGLHHGEGAAVALGLALGQDVEVVDLGADEEHRGAVLAGSDAGAAADAFRGVHGLVGDGLGHRDVVGLRGGAGADGDEAAGLDHLVEAGAVDGEVLEHREGAGAPRLDGDRLAVAEVAHVQLAGRHAREGAVGHAVDRHRAHAADAFAAVVVEGEGVLAGLDELLVEHVHHLEERGRGRHRGERMLLEGAGLAAALTPDAQLEREGGFFSVVLDHGDYL